MKFKITDIDWDTDGEKVDYLPTEILVANIDIDDEYLSQYKDKDIPSVIEAEICDWLSDTYGFCNFGFKYKRI